MNKIFIWHHTNAWADNIESVIEMIVFGTFMASLSELRPYKKSILLLVSAGVLLYMVDIFFIQGIWKLATIALVAQCAFLVTIICIYYYKLITTINDEISLFEYPPFWATTALLFYSLIGFFYFGTFSYMVYTSNFYFFNLVKVFANFSCAMLYSMLAVSFFCFRLQVTKSERLTALQ